MRLIALVLLLSLSACSCKDWGERGCPVVFPGQMDWLNNVGLTTLTVHYLINTVKNLTLHSLYFI